MASILISSSGIILPSGNTWIQQTGNGVNINATNFTVKAADVESGTNLNGGTLTLRSGKGTGDGTSKLSFDTATPITPGSTLQEVSTKMVILGSGQVGIGTTSPSVRFHLAGSGTNDYAKIDTGLNLNPVAAPPVPILSGPTAGGSLGVGAYYYCITYITDMGGIGVGETAPALTYTGPVTTTAGNNTIGVSVVASTDYRVTGIRLYRTGASPSTPTNDIKKVCDLPNTTQVYNDGAADGTRTGNNKYYAENTTNAQIYIGTSKGLFIGSNSTSIGQGALASITTGGNNTVMGFNASNTATTAINNVYMGSQAAQGASSSNNVGIGRLVLLNATGGSNVAVGSTALQSNSSGTDNTGVGWGAGLKNNTGSYNVFIGSFSMWGGGTRALSNSVFIGYYSGAYETVSSKLFIDAIDRATEAKGRTDSLIYGIFNATPSSQQLTINAGNVYIKSGNINIVCYDDVVVCYNNEVIFY